MVDRLREARRISLTAYQTICLHGRVAYQGDDRSCFISVWVIVTVLSSGHYAWSSSRCARTVSDSGEVRRTFLRTSSGPCDPHENKIARVVIIVLP